MDNTISSDSIEFLIQNYDIWERHKVGNYKYLTDAEKKIFQQIAKEVDNQRHFSIYACDACIRDLVKYVFTAYENQLKTVPASNKPSKKK